MTALTINDLPWSLTQVSTLGQARPEQMSAETRRTYLISVPRSDALLIVRPIVADLADDLRRFAQVDFEVERRWLDLGLPDADTLWELAPELLGDLLECLGLARDVVESILLTAPSRSVPPGAWLNEDAHVCCLPDSLVLTGDAWIQPASG